MLRTTPITHTEPLGSGNTFRTKWSEVRLFAVLVLSFHPPLPPTERLPIWDLALTTVRAPMEPHRVDEFMRAAWGHIYTLKDAEDHVKRTKQMLAKVGDADSSVDNAAKVEPPGALPMAYDGAHPKESAMAPDKIRADIAYGNLVIAR